MNDPRETHHSEPMTANPRGINVTIYGTMGLNGWYVSGVVITITGQGINHTYYSFNNQTWDEYLAPITINNDGGYALYVYYMDPDGEYHYYGPYPFKIDKTPPTLNVTVTTNFWKTVWRITVNASDTMSGVAKMEFYVDDVLVGNATAYPYIFIFILRGKYHVVQVIVYDNAGNANMPIITSCIQSQDCHSAQQKNSLFHDLINNLILYLQMKIRHLLD